MKLSEAIRLGAMLKPQGTGNNAIRSELQSCVLGAALDAIGVPVAERADGVPYFVVRTRWPVASCVTNCPVNGLPHDVIDIAWKLNDWPNYWTREQIADWVETVEREHEAQPNPDAQVAREALR